MRMNGKLRKLGMGLCQVLACTLMMGEGHYPLAEVEPGQRGVWRTVVTGGEMAEFELEILGVVPNFAGPGKAVILAKSEDVEHLRSGPVAGMSGSPVYIDGRLVGAYAYGFTWPKEQALIGITPIADMLALWEAAGQVGLESEVGGLGGDAVLSPLPTPLAVSGLGTRSIDLFAEAWAALGLAPQAGVGGGGGTAAVGGEDLVAGAPVAAVLMHGDFSAAATGTVTLREGERLLGFGHPFLQWGSVEMPMAGAEIYAIVRNLRQSFKLANSGPVVGTLVADRRAGVAGVVGPVPKMAQVTVDVAMAGFAPQQYTASLFRDRRLAPLLLGSVVAEGLGQNAAAAAEQTILLEGEVVFEGQAPLRIRHAAAGSGAEGVLALDIYERMERILNNASQPVALDSVALRAQVTQGMARAEIVEVAVGRDAVVPGAALEVSVVLQPWRGAREVRQVTLAVPETAAAWAQLEVRVVDAIGYAQLSGAMEPWWQADDLEGMLAAWAGERAQTDYAVVLLGRGRGQQVEGRRLQDLPGSAARQVAGGQRVAGSVILAEQWVARADIVSGEVTARLPVRTVAR